MGKEIMILRGEIKTPPLSSAARREIGYLLRELQGGETLSLPHSRPMPNIGARCHELRENQHEFCKKKAFGSGWLEQYHGAGLSEPVQCGHGIHRN